MREVNAWHVELEADDPDSWEAAGIVDHMMSCPCADIEYATTRFEARECIGRLG